MTGGAQGIGKATVRGLLDRGYGVAFVDQDREAGEETEREYAERGTIHFVSADVGDYVQVVHAVGEVIEKLGRIDGVYCFTLNGTFSKPLAGQLQGALAQE